MRIELTNRQKSWTPWLYDSRMTLGELYRQLPGDAAATVPWYVNLLEHPKSPLALAGAVDLFTHDCIHFVLGRGLLPQDEAFVLGFTIGTSRCCPDWHPRVRGFCARHLYRGTHRFSQLEREVFDYAVVVGRWSPVPALGDIDFRAHLHQPLDHVRAKLGIDAGFLDEIYRSERLRWPNTPASRRLGTSSLGCPAIGASAARSLAGGATPNATSAAARRRLHAPGQCQGTAS